MDRRSIKDDLMNIIATSPADLYHFDPDTARPILSLDRLTKEQMKAIQSVSFKCFADGRYEASIKMFNKIEAMKALDQILKEEEND